MRLFRKFFAFLILVCVLWGCSAERRISRIAHRNGLSAVRTEIVRDTVTVRGFDTLVVAPADNNMFNASAENVRVTGFVRGDTVVLRIRQKPDTVIVDKEVEYEYIQGIDLDGKSGIQFFVQWGQFLLSLLVLVLVIKALKK